MNDIQGMTIGQFKNVLAEMHTIYPYEDDKTFFGSTRDEISLRHRHVEIFTKDANTDITIHMQKYVDIDTENF